MSGWEGYIYQIQHKYSAEKKDYVKTNLCAHAAIIGKDGCEWAVSSNWPILKEYMHKQEQDDGSVKDVSVNEFKCCLGAATGN